METSNKVHEAIDGFKLPGELKECIRYGSGHINDTYRLTYETPQGTKRYILQRMSKSIFKKPVELMENVSGVTAWLRKKIIENGGDPERATSASTAVHANRCVPPRPSSMRMICRTSGLGTRMPLSTSSLKSAIWAALPPMVQSAKTRNRSPRCRRRTSKLICG